MTEMTLERAETACAELSRLGEELLETHSAEVARKLIRHCALYRASMRGKFGNVREQLGRVSAAADEYTRNIYVSGEVDPALRNALAGMDIALGLHRSR